MHGEQAEEGREQLHALGQVTGKEGAASVGARFYLTDASQAGKPEEVLRCGCAWAAWTGARICCPNILLSRCLSLHTVSGHPHCKEASIRYPPMLPNPALPLTTPS
jgi:hypothetical protein